MIIIDPTAGNNANTVIIRGTFAYNYTGRSLTDGTTTVALNANGEANLLRYLNLIARGNAIHLTGTAPPVFTAPEPTAPPAGPTTTVLASGSTWFDLPASPAIGDMVDATAGLFVPFFYDNSVVTSLGGNSQFPALPLRGAATGAIAGFVNMYDYDRISGGQIPEINGGGATADGANGNDLQRTGGAGANQVSGYNPGGTIALRSSTGTRIPASGTIGIQADGFFNSTAARDAVTYVGGTALADAGEGSYWYRTNRFTGTLTWNGTIWNPTTGTLPTS